MKLLPIILFLLFAGLVSAELLQPGQCTNVSYANLTNDTVNLSFCAATISYSALNLTLDPGQTLNGAGFYENYTSYCRPLSTNYTGGVCMLEKYLGSGEQYSRNDGACSLNLSCQACTQPNITCGNNNTISYDFDFEIGNNDTHYFFTFDNKTEQFPMLNSNTYAFSISRTCPEVIVNNTPPPTLAELDLARCAELLAVSNDRAYSGLVTVAEVLKTSTDTSRTCVADLGGAKANEEYIRGQFESTDATARECTELLSTCNSDKADYWTSSWVMSVAALAFFISTCVFAYLYWRD
jgi:hypothetical protein